MSRGTEATLIDPKRLTKVEREIYRRAMELLSGKVSAPELSALFFGPGGRLGALGKTEAQRKSLVDSDLYEWLQAQLAHLRQREVEQFEREIAELSGRLTVVVPKSLHAALEREAVHEGVSLSELIRLKLGVSYSAMIQSTIARERAPPPLPEKAARG